MGLSTGKNLDFFLKVAISKKHIMITKLSNRIELQKEWKQLSCQHSAGLFSLIDGIEEEWPQSESSWHQFRKQMWNTSGRNRFVIVYFCGGYTVYVVLEAYKKHTLRFKAGEISVSWYQMNLSNSNHKVFLAYHFSDIQSGSIYSIS